MTLQVKKSLLMNAIGLVLFTNLALTGCNQTPDKKPNPQTDTTAPVESSSQENTTQTETSPEAKADIQTIEQPVTILALGDSLTEGLGVPEQDAYPAQLQQALKDMGYVNAKVINSGLSGETSTGMVNRLNWALKTKPDLAIVTIGANDAMRGLEVANLEKNLRTAIERLQSENIIVILGGMQIYDNLGNEYVKVFSDTYPKLAKEYDVAFIPFFLEGVGGDAELNQADGLHPTKTGYAKIVAKNILPVLEPVLAEFVEGEMKETNLL